jgi:hypothetical protein
LDDRSRTSGALIVRQSVTRPTSPPRMSLAEPSVWSAGDLIEVAPGSPPLLVVNSEAGLPGFSQPDAAPTVELTMEDY